MHMYEFDTYIQVYVNAHICMKGKINWKSYLVPYTKDNTYLHSYILIYMFTYTHTSQTYMLNLYSVIVSHYFAKGHGC